MIRFYVIIIAVLIFIGSLFSAIYYYRLARERKEQITQQAQLHNKVVEHYRNDNGILIAKNSAALLTNESLKAEIKAGGQPGLKEFKGVRKNGKNVVGTAQIGASVANTANLIKQPDSSYYYKSKFKEASARIVHDTLKIVSKYSVPLQIVVYRSRKFWVFSKWHYDTEAYSSNPDVNISLLQAIVIKR